VPAGAAMTFGDTIHRTLKDFYQGIKEGQKLTQKDLLETLAKNWSSLGYASKAHEQKMKKQAEKILTAFFQKFDHKLVPKDLEQSFMIKISPDLKVGGKIDRVDQLKDGRLEIIDYKTGKTWEQKEVDKSLQMTAYALAATDKGIYDQKPENLVLTFYFLDSGQKISTQRTKEQLEEAKVEIQKKAKEIQQSLFEPKPSMLCDFCEYRLLCEASTSKN
jgi:DNA helicase-2/ATP-dependent DNA helicase PcrA